MDLKTASRMERALVTCPSIPGPTYCISYFANNSASIFGPFGTDTARKNSSILPAGVNVISIRAGFSPVPEKQCGTRFGPSTLSPGLTSIQ